MTRKEYPKEWILSRNMKSRPFNSPIFCNRQTIISYALSGFTALMMEPGHLGISVATQ